MILEVQHDAGLPQFPGALDVIADKEERRALWDGLFHDGFPPQTLDDARQVLVWFQLWRRGQALLPMIEPKIISWAMDRALAALDEGDEP